MAVKKSELYSLLWDACNKLRGGVEPSRYKDYVLVLLFFKYVSAMNFALRGSPGKRIVFAISPSLSTLICGVFFMWYSPLNINVTDTKILYHI